MQNLNQLSMTSNLLGIIHLTADFENTLYIEFTTYCLTTMQPYAWWRRNIT